MERSNKTLDKSSAVLVKRAAMVDAQGPVNPVVKLNQFSVTACPARRSPKSVVQSRLSVHREISVSSSQLDKSEQRKPSGSYRGRLLMLRAQTLGPTS